MQQTSRNPEATWGSETLHEQLRRRREAADVDLDSVADATGIQVHYFRAIEQGDVDSLPEGIYRRNFIRSYLVGIGIEDRHERETIVNQFTGLPWQPRFADLGPAEEPAVRRRFPLPVAASIAIVVGLGFVARLAWNGLAVDEPAGAAPAAQVLEQVAGVPAASEAAGSASEVSVPVAAVAAQPAAVPAASEPGAPAAEVTAAVASDAGAAAQSAEALPEAGVEQAPGVDSAVLRAKGKVWLRISPESGPSKDYLLRSGQRLELDLRAPVRLWIGNAGGLELLLDEQVISLGRQGQVRKMKLDPEALTELTDA